jgi:hypothetical protein
LAPFVPETAASAARALSPETRHFYASTLLDAGENIRALAEYLGHADPGFTLRTYTHLMPGSSDRTRKAVDNALGSYNTVTSNPPERVSVQVSDVSTQMS